MLKKMKWIVVPALVCAGATSAAATTALKIHTAKLSPNKQGGPPTQIWVQFETPVALTDCQIEYPSKDAAKCPQSTAPWDVVVYDEVGAATPIPVTSSSDPIGHLQANGLVLLALQSPLPARFSRIDLMFTKGNQPHFSIDASPAPATKWIAAAKTKDDSNVYLSGIFAPAAGTSPTYTVDSKANYILRSFAKGAYTVSATGDVNTDKKKTADPDSFHWAIPVQHVETFNVTEQWSAIGMELDKKANAINLVSAPSVTRAVGYVFARPDGKNPGTSTVAASVGLELSGGLEFGSNLKNDYAVANKTIGGQGGFLRGVPSANCYLIIPRVLRLSKISVTSSYTARIPTRNEVFLETRHRATPFPELASNTRHYIQNTLNFMLTDYVGIQIKHQYGSLPPAFSFVQNSGSIGLVFALKETRVPQSP
jgi:hypothetical protein